jgi:3-phosphoshikimate 1-carboxyvinyltransferase
MNARFDRSGPLRGAVTPPADKSISHRAALLAAMSERPVTISNYLHAADTLSTLRAVEALGAGVQDAGDGTVSITGVGLHGPRAPAGPIDVGNAGTLMRLLPGWLAGQTGRSYTLDGDASIRRRPVDRIAEPLSTMGASIEARDGRLPPFTISGRPLHGIDYTLPVPSAQVKSCVLLAGLGTEGTTVREPVPSRDHTERMLLAAGARLERRPGSTAIRSSDGLQLSAVEVPADPSSAAFLLAAALLVPGSEVTLNRVGVNWTRTGFIRIAQRMGARIEGELEPAGAFAPEEPVRDLTVRAGQLRAATVEADEVPLAIDELPLVALLGCFAEGETVVRGAAELRVKESDRIATVVDGLRGLGAEIEAAPDGFAVMGTGGLRGGAIDSHGDHRLALLGAVAGLASREGVEVRGMDAARVSYPDFASDLRALGRHGGT